MRYKTTLAPPVFLLLLPVLVVLVFVLSATATDPPHNLNCADCHKTHSAPGGTITKVGGNANLCFSCHIPGGTATAKPFAVSDQAFPWPGLAAATASGTSHRWDSGPAGHVTFGGGAVTPSTGTVKSEGAFTGPYAKTYTITITTAGNVGVARFSWTATTPGGGSGANVLTGVSVPLDQGISVTFTDGTGTSFQLNDKWYVYVRTDINAPSNPVLSAVMENGFIMCSTCHDVHSQVNEPFDRNAPAYLGAGTGAGRHFQAVSNDVDQMCIDCHSARNVQSAEIGGSHAVGVTVPAAGDYKAPTTLPLDKTQNMVRCTTCHTLHYSPAGNGTVLRSANITALCTDCHTLADTTTPAAHLNTSTGSLWPGGKYGSTLPAADASRKGFCTNCHQPHGWPDQVTPTVTFFPKLLVERTDLYDDKTDPSTAENICYTCHDSSGPALKDAKTSFPAAGTAQNYQDQFLAQVYNGSTGNLDWSGTPWVETDGGGAGPAAGRVLVVVNDANCYPSGGNCVRLASSTVTTDLIYRPANLPTGVTVTLTYDWRRGGSGSAQYQCQISSNGGTSWTTLATYSTIGTGSATHNITTYANANTRIRFRPSTTGAGSYFYVDNVNISYTTAGMKSGHFVDDAVQVSGPYRSVECRDCHDVHKAQAGSHTYSTTATATRNLVSNPTKGVFGLSVDYTGLGNFVAPSSSNYTAVTSSQYEYQICFKCHSAYSWAFGTAPNGMSPNGSATRPVLTDLAQEFSPANKSGHPVVTGLDNYTNSVAVGSPARKGLQATYLKAPWATNIGQQTMMCSDCHNTDAASPAAQGPHGSSVQFVLRGPNSNNWPNVTLTNFATSWCANCHNNFTSDPHSGNHNSYYCYQCHIVIPHGGKVSRLIGDRETMPARYAYNNTLTTMNISTFVKNAVGSYAQSGSCAATSCYSSHSAITAGENW